MGNFFWVRSWLKKQMSFKERYIIGDNKFAGMKIVAFVSLLCWRISHKNALDGLRV